MGFLVNWMVIMQLLVIVGDLLCQKMMFDVFCQVTCNLNYSFLSFYGAFNGF